MIERLIENWLVKSSERSFQKPFCYMLSDKGYTIVHVTRHCGMEMGKDIIAIARDGTPCAFQLKSAQNGKISLNQWRKEINKQVFDLVVGKIVHPSIDSKKHHRSYLVTNGELEEEVSRAIDDMNQQWINSGQKHLKLETIVKGEMLKMAVAMGSKFLPFELMELKTFLEFQLNDGKGLLPKDKLSYLFESIFPLIINKRAKKPSRPECGRLISSAAILNSISITNFSNKENYFAEIEAWTLYISYMLALVEKWRLPLKYWKKEFDLAIKFIYSIFGNLCDELKKREHFVEGISIVDHPFYRIRLTCLLAMISIYALWRRIEKVPNDETDDFIRDFCLRNKNKLNLWGEAAITQFLAFFWYYRKIDATTSPEKILTSLVSTICKLNNPRNKESGLANPYYEAIDILPYILRVTDETLEDSFVGISYSLEGLLHLLIRRNWKQTVKLFWPDYTRIASSFFKPANPWRFFKWRNEPDNKSGKNYTIFPKHTQNWQDLKDIAFESEGKCIPKTIKKYPVLLLLFLCVYPHRMNSQIIRFLDEKFKYI